MSASGGACRVVQATRSLVYYRSRKDPLTAFRQRMREVRRRGCGSAIDGCGCSSNARLDRRVRSGSTACTYIEEGLALRRKRP